MYRRVSTGEMTKRARTHVLKEKGKRGQLPHHIRTIHVDDADKRCKNAGKFRKSFVNTKRVEMAVNNLLRCKRMRHLADAKPSYSHADYMVATVTHFVWFTFYHVMLAFDGVCVR